MLNNDPSPIEYHYKTGIKLDYFILSVDIALLGWTIVNTGWLPHGNTFALSIGVFWVFIIFSVIFGVIRQLYNARMFGLNYQYLHAGELADVIEKNVSQGGDFKDQQTDEIVSKEEFKKYAIPQREIEEDGKELYKKDAKRSALFANLAVILLLMALFLLAGIKFYVLII